MMFKMTKKYQTKNEHNEWITNETFSEIVDKDFYLNFLSVEWCKTMKMFGEKNEEINKTEGKTEVVSYSPDPSIRSVTTFIIY